MGWAGWTPAANELLLQSHSDEALRAFAFALQVAVAVAVAGRAAAVTVMGASQLALQATATASGRVSGLGGAHPPPPLFLSGLDGAAPTTVTVEANTLDPPSCGMREALARAPPWPAPEELGVRLGAAAGEGRPAVARASPAVPPSTLLVFVRAANGAMRETGADTERKLKLEAAFILALEDSRRSEGDWMDADARLVAGASCGRALELDDGSVKKMSDEKLLLPRACACPCACRGRPAAPAAAVPAVGVCGLRGKDGDSGKGEGEAASPVPPWISKLLLCAWRLVAVWGR